MILPTLPSPVLDALMSVMIHSLWQFSLIGILYLVIQRMSDSRSAAYKYRLGYVAMISMLVVAVTTFMFNYEPQLLDNHGIQTIIVQSLDQAYIENSGPISRWDMLTNWIVAHKLNFFAAWVMGIVFLLLRLVISMGYIAFLKTYTVEVTHPIIVSTCEKLKTHFGGHKMPTIYESSFVSSPILAGFFRPIIILPMAIVNHLTTEEVDAILAHEIAHYLRHDIWFNFFQHLIETIFYYHPAVWWVSYQIRTERENCCDDIAISYTQNSLAYAKTLIHVQELQTSILSPSLAMNMANNQLFSNRIKRILSMQSSNLRFTEMRTKIVSLVCLIVVVGLGINQLFATDNDMIKIFTKKVQNLASGISSDTLKPVAKSTIMVQKITDDKSVKLSMENGEITKLEVNGKLIPPDKYNEYNDVIQDVKPNGQNDGNTMRFYFGDGSDNSHRGNFDFPDLDSLVNRSKAFRFDFKDRQNGLGDDQKRWHNFHFNMDSLEKGIIGFGNELSRFNMDSIMGEIAVNKRFFQDNFGNGMIFKDENNEDMPNRSSRIRQFQFPDGVEHDIDINRNTDNYSSILGNALNSDGLLIADKENTVELTGKYLKINGEKQPTNIWNKYRTIFEEESGLTLDKKSKLVFQIQGKASKRKYRAY